jgi:acetylornithine aminotransferase
MAATDSKTNASEMGEYLHNQLTEALADVSGVKLIRSKGLMLGIVLEKDCGELVAQALEAGLLINVTAGNVVRLLPPLTLSQSEADEIICTLKSLIAAFLKH